MMSICLLMVGVYASSSPSLNLNGQVSYKAHDAAVLVQASMQNDKMESDQGFGLLTYPGTAPTVQGNTADGSFKGLETINIPYSKSGGTVTKASYFDFTLGQAFDDAQTTDETLATWNVGTIEFEEGNLGVKPIVLGFKITNYSNFPISIKIQTAKTLSEMESKNVVMDNSQIANPIGLNAFGKTKSSVEVKIVFKVKDDSKSVLAEDLLGMNVEMDNQHICATCNGIGHVEETCGTCNGSGNCPECGGNPHKQCEVCSGQGYTNCTMCEGTGNVPCTACSGTGFFEEWQSCGSCGGSGMDMSGEGMPCSACGGSGGMNATVSCTACGGTTTLPCSNCSNGRIDCTCENGIRKCENSTCEDGKCAVCSGTGKIDATCTDCDGTGK